MCWHSNSLSPNYYSFCIVGKVIGKKGAVITHIQRTTQTEVVVLPVSTSTEPLWSPLSISGDPAKVQSAFNIIKDMLGGTFVFLFNVFYPYFFS